MDAQHKRTPAINEEPKKIDPFKNIPEVVEERSQDSQGNVVSLKHVRGSLLGKGGFAQVYLSTLLPSKEKYALKIVAKSSLQKARAKAKLQSEINIHQALNHEHIVRFSHCFEDPSYTYLLLELCSNHSMSDMMNQRKRITEPESRYYIAQLVSSLQYLHRHLIIHRDLKLGNLFLDKYMRLKVGDFGLAAKLENAQERRMTVCGTPNYIAPELLEGKKGHSFEVDVWSTGIILYTFLVGKPPFQSKDVKSTYKRILSNTYSYPEGFIVSADARSLVSLMLQQRPEHRPSLQQILSHSFFTGPGNFLPSSLPVTSLKEIPILAAPIPTVPAISYSKPIPGLAGKQPSIYGNENNPNAANILAPLALRNPTSVATVEDPLSSAFGGPRRSSNVASKPVNTVEDGFIAQENTDRLQQQPDERLTSAAAVSRSISARMRTALTQKSSVVEKFSVQATMNGDRQQIDAVSTTGTTTSATAAMDRENGKPSTLGSLKTGAAAVPYTSRFASNTRPAKFDIYVDNHLEENNRRPLAVESTSKSQSEMATRTSRYETRQQTNKPLQQQQQVPVASLGRILKDLDEMKLEDENIMPASNQQQQVGQKRIDISTKENFTAYSPTDAPNRLKRVKEAWSNTDQRKEEDGENKEKKEREVMSVPMMTVSTPPEQVLRSEDVQQLRLNTLETMHEMLNDSISLMDQKTGGTTHTTKVGDFSPILSLEPMAKTWVVRYVDYTSKYGLGFLLNNGMAGVYFNDSTKMVMSSNGMVVQYVERVRRESSFGSENSSQKYSIDHYPPELQKKVTLMKHFRNYLLDQERLHGHEKTIGMEDNIADTNAFKAAFTKDVAHIISSSTSKLGDSVDEDGELPYLKKWVRTKHAVLFRLSNRTVQVVFYDKSEVLLSSEARMITYVNKQGDRSEHALNDVMLAGRVDIAKRLKYTKDIMHRLISSQSAR